jgi:hypothetical protein
VTLREKFEIFDRDNPEVFASVLRISRQYFDQGIRVGARHVWEIMRWERWIETRDHASSFKLNDHYVPYYARKVMDADPLLAGYFEIRALRSEQDGEFEEETIGQA